MTMTSPPQENSDINAHTTANYDDIKQNIRKAYDNIAPTYLEWTKPSHKTRLIYLNKLLSHLSPNQQDGPCSILELGCGAGVPCTQVLAAHKNLNVTGNDISSAQIALARERLPDSVKLVEGDMMGLEFGDAELDAVVGMYSIIHLPREEQVELLKRVFEWLKGGGLVLVNFAKEEIEAVRDGGWLGGQDGCMFWSGWGGERSCEVLREIGFEVLVREVVGDVEEDGNGEREVEFLWVIARKPGSRK